MDLQYIKIGSDHYIYIFFDIVSLLVQSSVEKYRKKQKAFAVCKKKPEDRKGNYLFFLSFIFMYQDPPNIP